MLKLKLKLHHVCSAFIFVPILLYCSAASAYYPNYVSGTQHLVEISQKSSGNWKSLVVLDNSAIGEPIHDKTKKILSAINSNLFDALELEAEKISDIPTLTYKKLNDVTINGAINTKIMTDNNGIITVELSGFSISAVVRLGITGFSSTANVKTSDLKFAADYDIITGRVYNLRDIGNTRIDVDLDADSLLGSLVVESAESLLNIFDPSFFQGELDDIISGQLNNEYYIAGIDSVVPTGEWIVSGIDLGSEIQDLIRGVSAGKYISIGISENNLRYYTGYGYRTTYTNKVELDISGNYKVGYENAPVFSKGDWINPCAGAGGANSGCYEP